MSKGYYETGFESEPFAIESPPPVSPEEQETLRRWRINQVWDSLEAQGAFNVEPPGVAIWERYFSNPNRPSINQVLLLRKVLRPSKG